MNELNLPEYRSKNMAKSTIYLARAEEIMSRNKLKSTDLQEAEVFMSLATYYLHVSDLRNP